MAQSNHKTMIGGQAVIEGVMMRGVRSSAVAVRQPDGGVYLDTWQNSSIRDRYPILGIPVVRGVVNLVESLLSGYKTLMRSAELAGLEDEEEEQPVPAAAGEAAAAAAPAKEKKDDSPLVMAFSAVLGVVIAVALFTLLPAAAVKYTSGIVPYGVFRPVAEGLIRLAIFVGYLAVVARMPEMKRLYAYHGAEHKTIYCYEHGEELTPENARRYTRLHPRCGTSFLLVAILVGIVVYSFLSWDNLAVRVLLKLLLAPLVVGLSYEVIRFAGRHDTGLMRAVLAPGLWLQRLTTREPDDSQLEVAIASLKAVLTDNPEDDAW